MLYEIKSFPYSVGTDAQAKDVLKRYLAMREATAAYIAAGKSIGLTFTSNNRLTGMRQDLQELKRRYKEATRKMVDRELHRTIRGKVFKTRLDNDIRRYPEALKDIRKKIKAHRKESQRTYDKLLNRKPGQFMLEFMEKHLHEPKSPTTNDKYVGIEIECAMPYNADFTQLVPFYKWVTVGTDGSVHHKDGEDGREIRVCMKQSEVRTVLPQILEIIKNLGGYVNRSCGLHVHLDQRHNDNPARTFNNLVRSLGLLYKVVPASRRQNNYCHRNKTTVFEDAVHQERYKAINASSYNKYKTIEVRLFGGTLEANKIANWTEILWAIADSEMFLRCPTTFKAAQKKWKLSDENTAWLEARAEVFKELNKNVENESLLEAQPQAVESPF